MITIQQAQALTAKVKLATKPDRIELAGSHRRGLASIHDVDMVVIAKEHGQFIQRLSEIGMVVGGADRLTVIIDQVTVDILFALEPWWGSALLHYTGSKQFNIRCRSVAKSRGLMLNQYGLWEADVPLARETEADVLRALKMEKYLDPVTRRH